MPTSAWGQAVSGLECGRARSRGPEVSGLDIDTCKLQMDSGRWIVDTSSLQGMMASYDRNVAGKTVEVG